MAKKNTKKSTGKLPVKKKVTGTTAPKKKVVAPSKPAKAKSGKSDSKSKVKVKEKPKPKARVKPKQNPKAKNVPVKKSQPAPPQKKIKKEVAPQKATKAKWTPPQPAPKRKAKPQPVQAPPKPRGGSPTQLSMALEESRQALVKPRITRSKGGNLLFQIEYTIRSSPAILFDFLTSPSGLAQWFADSVDINEPYCTFVWEGYEEVAIIIDSIQDQYIRYKWEYSDEDEYFEFRITKNEITGDTILIITDFAADNEIKDQQLLWDSQIKTLIQQIGG